MRTIDDANYLARLPSYYWRAHERWKDRILGIIEQVLFDLENTPLEEVMCKYNLSQRDIALLVRLNVVTDAEAKKYGLDEIEAVVPL